VPIARWALAQMNDKEDWDDSYQSVAQLMVTDLFTVHPDDLVDLAASLMEWRHIRHVPVEDKDGRLVGMVPHRALLRLLSRGSAAPDATAMTVQEIMTPNPTTV